MPTVVGVTDWVPLTASVPLQLPEAVHDVAVGSDQVMDVALPAATDAAAAVTVGAPGGSNAVTVTVADAEVEVPTVFAHVTV